jgi:class 3 adenylate cyclase
VPNGTPEVRYVALGECDIAYRVFGEGPLDLLYIYGVGSNVDALLDDPWIAQLLDGFCTFSRVISFDRRGVGSSDGVPRDAIPTWEGWTEDVSAVLDATSSGRVAIVAGLDAGPVAVLFAAMQPDRVSALVLSNTTARYLLADDYSIGEPQASLDAAVDGLRTVWGTADFVRFMHPRLVDDAEFVQATARRMRSSATPTTAAAQLRYSFESLDVRPALSLVQAPTLVLHTSHNPFIPVAHGRYLADHISGARFVEVPGRGLGFDDDQAHVVSGHISEFLTGERPVVEVDRVLTTVLFTDIVGSTERVATMGDQRWRVLLDAHDRAVRAQLRRFHGREVKTTGDGFCASFDGPARAIRCAQAVTESARTIGVEVRAGIHTGECEVRDGDLAGLAVHIAARVSSLAGPSEVLVSSIVKDLVAGSGIELVDRGDHQLRGVPASWRLFAAHD